VEAIVKKSFSILRGKLAVVAVDFGDPAHPDLNGINPGKSGDIYLTVTNNGSEDFTGGTLNLEPLNNCLTATRGEVVIEYLAVGESMRLATPFNVTASRSCHKKDIATFKLTGLYLGHISGLQIEAQGEFLLGRIVSREVEQSPAMTIPDSNPTGATAKFTIRRGITSLERISIHLDITHPYRGDIIGYLISPKGVSVQILKGTGGSRDDIHETLVGGQDFDFMAIKGHPINGKWKLVIVDKGNGDIGTLDHFKVMFQGY
jgi:subtilisin-like proprotein convertase family protein